MSGHDPIGKAPPGAQIALPIAQAHLGANLDSIDAIDSKAMFLMAINLAGIGIYIGAVVALGWMLECIIAPAALFTAAMVIGTWSLWRLKVPQFPSPASSIALLEEGLDDDDLAWVYLRAIAEASTQVDSILERKATLTLVLFLTTIGHVAASVASAAVWGG